MLKKILKLLSEEEVISQRKISKYLNISLGSVNKYLNQALLLDLLTKEEISYREKKYFLTEKGKNFLNKEAKINLAVILLAGKPKNISSSVGELKVESENIITRHLKLLKKNEISNVVLVVGYNADYYKKIKYKDLNIEIVENKNYRNTGNMYSLYLAKDFIQEDFLLIDGDLVYNENLLMEILKSKEKNVALVEENIRKQDDCVYVDLKNNMLKNLSKDKSSLENISGQLIGIHKIQYRNYLKMIEKFEKINNSFYFYEYFFKDPEIFNEFYCLQKDNFIWGEVDNLKQYKYVLEHVTPILDK